MLPAFYTQIFCNFRKTHCRQKMTERCRSPHSRPSFVESSTLNNEEKKSNTHYQNFQIKITTNKKPETEKSTPPNEKITKNQHSRNYGPPSKTYGEMSKELKTHKWNEKNLARLNKNLQTKNEKLTKNYETEIKLSNEKDEQIDQLKIRNSKLDRKLNKSRLEIDDLLDQNHEKEKKNRKLKAELYDKTELIRDLEEQLKICKNKLDKKGDKKSKNYRYKSSSPENDW